jgi:hypothetical protein
VGVEVYFLCPPLNKAARRFVLGEYAYSLQESVVFLFSFCCSPVLLFSCSPVLAVLFSLCCSFERVPVEGEQLAAERNVNAALHQEIAMAMLQSRHLSLPMLVQCAFVHNALKVVLAGLKVSQRMDDKTLVSGGWWVVVLFVCWC